MNTRTLLREFPLSLTLSPKGARGPECLSSRGGGIRIRLSSGERHSEKTHRVPYSAGTENSISPLLVTPFVGS